MQINFFQYITQDVPGFSHPELATLACKGGAQWVQLRVKNKSYSEWKSIASEVKEVCKKYGAKLIINDNVQLAKEIEADGVHLGKQDMSPETAREILGGDFIIGGTANTFEDIQKLAIAKVNYIGLGPFRFTNTKENLSPVLGLEGYSSIMKQCTANSIHIPVIAIGGITTADVMGLLETGVYGIAVSGAVNLAENKTVAVKSFIQTSEVLKTSEV